MKLSKQQWLGMLRHTLTFFGGISMTMGYIDESTFEDVVGLTMSLVGVIWSIMEKNK